MLDTIYTPSFRYFRTPYWIKSAVFYQIFPDRFCNGDPSINPENVQPWGTTPTQSNYMGGDLQGIINSVGYLKNLGVNALYLNPIFQALSNHKYNTHDYYTIDPHLGTYKTLWDLAHLYLQKQGMYLILDGVFNHCGRGFFAFQSLVEQQEESPYRDWFHVTEFPINPYDPDKPCNYHCWWNIPSLPKFNTDHEPVRKYIFDVAYYWLKRGPFGWRLDVPEEIKDHNFWRQFRSVAKASLYDAYLVGEIWGDANPWLDGSQFDGVMNYLFFDLCRDFFAREAITVEDFAHGLEKLTTMYHWSVVLSQLNLVGSHDTSRFITAAGGDASRMFPTVFLQMTFPGVPCIYYGDEIGMEGETDPYCRGCFPWDKEAWNITLRNWTKKCIALRKEHTALQWGNFQMLVTDNESRMFAFARWCEKVGYEEDEYVVVVVNPGEKHGVWDIPIASLPFPCGDVAKNLVYSRSCEIRNGYIQKVRVPAKRGVVLQVNLPEDGEEEKQDEGAGIGEA